VSPDPHGELAEELRLLVETVLERIEPALRRAATGGEGVPEWSSCSWCPLCAAVALIRGEHHEVVASLAEHGTAMVTVLREALAGVPVEPIRPEGHDHIPADRAESPENGTRGSADVADSKQYKPIPVTIKT
jgi:hypothetical protein